MACACCAPMATSRRGVSVSRCGCCLGSAPAPVGRRGGTHGAAIWRGGGGGGLMRARLAKSQVNLPSRPGGSFPKLPTHPRLTESAQAPTRTAGSPASKLCLCPCASPSPSPWPEAAAKPRPRPSPAMCLRECPCAPPPSGLLKNLVGGPPGRRCRCSAAAGGAACGALLLCPQLLPATCPDPQKDRVGQWTSRKHLRELEG